VPSQTELLFDLGLDEEVVGITRFCVAPANEVTHRTKIGGTKRFHFDIIDDLQPDLILGNKEENSPDGITRLQEKYPVWISDIDSLPDALEMIASIGRLVERPEMAGDLISEIRAGFASLPEYPRLKAAYLIWKDPYMAAGSDTFIHEMLGYCGLDNIFGFQRRYPRISIDSLGEAEVILLSSEPYPFGPADVDAALEKFPNKRVGLVDGRPFSWYGSRLRHTPGYFKRLRSTLKRKLSFDLRSVSGLENPIFG
jgi:ABC-type Fe3+-hydroxamate transport system substrate-binding protein